MKIVYSQEYARKITELRKYLERQFGTEARKKVMDEINGRIYSLKKYQKPGMSVRELFGIDSDYYVIYVAKNYIFYRIDGDLLKVDGIYNEREDFMRRMFHIFSDQTEV